MRWLQCRRLLGGMIVFIFLSIISSIYLGTWATQMLNYDGFLDVILNLLEVIIAFSTLGVAPVVLVWGVISIIAGILGVGALDSNKFYLAPVPRFLDVPKKDAWRISGVCAVQFILGAEVSILIAGFIAIFAHLAPEKFTTMLICSVMVFAVWMLIHIGQKSYVSREVDKIHAAQRAAAEEKARQQREEEERQRKEQEQQRKEQERQRAEHEAAERAAEQKRIQVQSEHERQFYAILVQQYGLQIAAVVAGGYKTYDVKSDVKVNVPENKKNYYTFYIDYDSWDWYSEERKPKYVTNSKRIQDIETQLAASGLLPAQQVKAAESDTDAPCLAQFVDRGEVCATPLFKMYGGRVSLGSSIPAVAIDEFITYRCKELEDQVSSRLSYFYSEYKSIRSGILGERAVQDVLDMHKGAFYVLNGLRIQPTSTDGRPVPTVETDSLILAPYGIFAIEIKNYAVAGQYGLKITADGNWYKVYQRTVGERGRIVTSEEPMSNPFAQNDRHIAYLEQVVNDILGRDMVHRAHIKNIIVLANDNVRIDCDPAAKQTVTRAGNLYNHLTQETKPLYTMEELDKLRSALAAMDIGEGAYPINDYTEELRDTVAAYQQLQNFAKNVKAAIPQCFADHPDFNDLK